MKLNMLGRLAKESCICIKTGFLVGIGLNIQSKRIDDLFSSILFL